MPREYPEQSYYPRAKVRLGIRFEEFGDTTVSEAVGKTITKSLIKGNGLKSKLGKLKAVKDTSIPGASRYNVELSSASKDPPQLQDTSDDELSHIVGGIVPLEATWNLNGIREADSLDLRLKFLDMPIDPRTVRSAWVEFYLGAVPADTAWKQASRASGQMAMLDDEWTDEHGQKRSNLRFQGWVDEWSVSWGTDAPAVKLVCRDNLTLLIDQEAPPKLVIGMKLPIHEAIATYLSNFPQCAGMSVEYRPGDADIPKLEDVLSRTAHRPKLGPAPAKGGGAASKLSVWDYITDVTGSIGHIARLEGTTIIIQRVRSLMAAEYAGRPDDPYRARKVGGTEMPYRRFIYGRNIEKMEVARKYAKASPTNVEVRCYYPERKKVLVARYPGKDDTVQGMKPGNTPDQKWLIWRVSGIKDESVLRLTAQSIYEAISRTELMVAVSTKNMASFGGGNMDPDILDMRAGDTFEVFTSRDEQGQNDTVVVESLLLAQARAREFLKKLGFGGSFIDAYVRAYTNSAFQTAYRMRTMVTRWHIDQGVSFDITGANYVEVRLDKALPEGEELKKNKGAKGKKA